MIHRHRHRRCACLVLMLPLLAACSGANRRITQSPPSDSRPQSTRAGAQSAPVDALADVLIRARELSDQGDRLRRAANLIEAQWAYQAALDLLWDFSRDREPGNFLIAREIDYLIVRIEILESARNSGGAPSRDLPERDVGSSDELRPGGRSSAASELAGKDSGFPIVLHDRVLAFLEYFTEGRGRNTIRAGLERMGRYAPMIRGILAEEGLPEDLIHLAQAESGFRPGAISSSAARGMWQFIASRGEEYGLRQTWWVDERSDPEKSTRAAARHLKDLYLRFGDWYLAMAAYNAGPGRVQSGIDQAGVRDFWALAERSLLPSETRNYVPTILAMALIGRDPSRFGFDIRSDEALNVERVPEREATDLRVISEALELPIETVQTLNPHVLRWATPPSDESFELILPVGYRAAYEEHIRPLGPRDRILFQNHTVASGETLSYLAGRYGVSVSAISEANRLEDDHLIRIGQSLIVPLSETSVPEVEIAELPAAAPTPPEIYQIQRGDTLSGIAGRFGLSVDAIRTWNNLSSNALLAGATLRLRPVEEPGNTLASADDGDSIVYSVRSGDTLTRIAASYRTSVDNIRAWNLDLDLTVIRPGDRITIYCSFRASC